MRRLLLLLLMLLKLLVCQRDLRLRLRVEGGCTRHGGKWRGQGRHSEGGLCRAPEPVDECRLVKEGAGRRKAERRHLCHGRRQPRDKWLLRSKQWLRREQWLRARFGSRFCRRRVGALATARQDLLGSGGCGSCSGLAKLLAHGPSLELGSGDRCQFRCKTHRYGGSGRLLRRRRCCEHWLQGRL